MLRNHHQLQYLLRLKHDNHAIETKFLSRNKNKENCNDNETENENDRKQRKNGKSWRKKKNDNENENDRKQNEDDSRNWNWNDNENENDRKQRKSGKSWRRRESDKKNENDKKQKENDNRNWREKKLQKELEALKEAEEKERQRRQKELEDRTQKEKELQQEQTKKELDERERIQKQKEIEEQSRRELELQQQRERERQQQQQQRPATEKKLMLPDQKEKEREQRERRERELAELQQYEEEVKRKQQQWKQQIGSDNKAAKENVFVPPPLRPSRAIKSTAATDSATNAMQRQKQEHFSSPLQRSRQQKHLPPPPLPPKQQEQPPPPLPPKQQEQPPPPLPPKQQEQPPPLLPPKQITDDKITRLRLHGTSDSVPALSLKQREEVEKELSKRQTRVRSFVWEEYLESPHLQGFLLKQDPQGFLVHKWRKRWFSLQRSRLLYYKQERKPGTKAGTPLGIISLQYATAIEPDTAGGPGKFVINTPDRIWYLDAGNETERDKWITGLREAKEIYELVKNKIREHTILTYGSDINQRKEGILERYTALYIWVDNYFVLQDGILFYYSSKGSKQKGRVALFDCKFEEFPTKGRSAFKIICKSEDNKNNEIVLGFKDDTHMQEWLNALLRQKVLIEDTINSIVF
jgi:hypothetical protein